MPTYIALMRLTDQGRKSIKQAPGRIEEAVGALHKMDGKLVALYAVMGEYDYVGIAEAPSDEVAMTFVAGLNAAGNVQTTTFRAFSKEDLAELLKRLP